MAPKGKKGGTAARSKKASTARRDTVEASPRSRGSSSLSPVKSAQSQSQSQSQTQAHAQSITDGDEGEGVGLEDIEVNDDLMQLLESTQGIGYEQPSGELEGGGVEVPSVLPLDNAAMSMSQGMDVDMEGLDMDACVCYLFCDFGHSANTDVVWRTEAYYNSYKESETCRLLHSKLPEISTKPPEIRYWKLEDGWRFTRPYLHRSWPSITMLCFDGEPSED